MSPRLAALAAVTACCLSLSACGSSSTSDPATPAPAAASSTTSSPAMPAVSSPATTASPVANGVSDLGTGREGYPRVIRLVNAGPATGDLLVTATTNTPSPHEAVFRSTNEGTSFSQVGSIDDPKGADGICCGSLYELPRQVGSLPAGSVVFAASYSQNQRPMSIDMYASRDGGSTWSKVSTVVTAPNAGGLFEPEIHLDTEGQLVVVYSDETDPQAHSQSLVERTTTTGTSWSSSRPVVALSAVGARPGMAGIRAMSDGRFLMTYELCGSTYRCADYDRTSSDGLHWGDPKSPGTKIMTASGAHFDDTPTFTVVGSGPHAGEIVLVGHTFVDSSGALEADNGRVLLTNNNDVKGSWTEMWAPVTVANTAKNSCSNYSSSLIPVHAGTRVLEVAQVLVGKVCVGRFASTPL